MAVLTDRIYMGMIMGYMAFFVVSTLVAISIAKKRKGSNQ